MGIIYILAAVSLASIICLIDAVRVKRSNPGFVFMQLFGVVSNIVCTALLAINKVGTVRTGLTVFYVSQAWLYFGAVWTIVAMGLYKHYKRYMIPIFITSVYKTVIILNNTDGRKVFNMAKHIYMGRTWWVAEPHAGIPPVLGLQGYYVALTIEMIIMFAALISYTVNADKIFRPKYIAIILIELLYLVPEFMTYYKKLPIWMVGTAINIACILWHYFVNHYSTSKLRNWSLDNFANEMSDGFILYDEYDDPIHMNDLLKETLTEELVEAFRNRNNLDEWLSHTVKVADAVVREYEKSNGEKVYFKTKKIELGRSDNHVGTIYILHDSTASILSISAMQEANRELERISRMKSDFLANMSHEIRTPMNAVIGMAELALRENKSPKVTEYLTQIQSSGRNLLNIINDILDFSKIEAGKMEIVTSSYEPLSEISDIANVLMTRIDDKDIELFVDVDVNLPHVLEGDAMRIRQILINLANNAIKFTRSGTVRICLTCEKISDDEIMLNYHVIDTGMGIRQEDLGRLFRNFEQVDSKRNREVEGTGLGLAISKSLCEAMGGSIGVQSEYGKGSDFFFNIPQKIIDPTLDIFVKEPESKCAFVINDNENMVKNFVNEMSKFAVESHHLPTVDSYKPSGKRDYIFFTSDIYEDVMRSFLDKNKEVTGVILVNFDSDFNSEQDNLRTMRRPETTLAMLSVLNDVEQTQREADCAEYYKIDFTAPDASVLIVDDNLVNITIAEGLLSSTHMKCTGAVSGKEAIELIAANTYDIVFMDHMMPEMDGVEATHIIRDTIPSAADVPIIALTANVMEGVKDMFISEGMNDFVAKPIDVKTLMNAVKRWLPAEKIIEGAPEDDSSMTGSYLNDSELVKYECLEYNKAIEVLGQVALYNKMVEEYYRSGADRAEALNAAFKSEDWPDYTIKIHALKSASRQIGAMQLGDEAERLEKAGHDNDIDVIKDDHQGFVRSYSALLAELSEYFPEDTTEATSELLPMANTEILSFLSDKLNKACEELDMDGMEEVKIQMQKYSYDESVMDSVKQLYKAIDNIDTDECIRLMEEINNR